MPTFGQRGLPQFPICKQHKRPRLQFRSTSPRRPKAGAGPGGHVRFVEKGLWAMLDRFQHLSVQPALHQRGARIHCRGKEPAQCYQKRWTSSIPDWARLSPLPRASLASTAYYDER